MKPVARLFSKSGNIAVWLILAVAIVAGLIFVFISYPELVQKYLPGLVVQPTSTTPSTPEQTPEPTPEQTPESTPESTPEPTPEPSPTPVVEATPEREVPLDFATIAATPSLWPKQVSLVKPIELPLVLDGKVVGQAHLAVGLVFPLVRVLPDLTKQQVEVLYQRNPTNISAVSVDLIQRATEMKNSAGSPTASAARQPAPKPTATTGAKSSAPEPMKTVQDFDSRITVSANRNKTTKIEGGDFDDKRDRIAFSIRFRNLDPNRAFPGLRMEFYLFGESLVNRKAVKLLQKVEKSFQLAPLEDLEIPTPETTTEWDNTGAIFGAKYKGWYLLIFGPDGKLLAEKTNVALFDHAVGLSTTTVGNYYNRKLESMTVE